MTLFQPPEPPSELPVYRPQGDAAPPTSAPPQPYPYYDPALYQRQPWPIPEQPAVRPRGGGSADVVITVILLVFGLLGTIVAVATSIALPLGIRSIYEGRGQGFFESSRAGHELTFLLWSHVVLLVFAIVGSVLLIRRKRVAFYVPLIAGFIAAIIFWIVTATYAVTDHSLQFVA